MKTTLILTILVSALPLSAQTTRISNVHYDVTFDATTATQRNLNVSMTFDVTGPGPVRLALPVWTPGAYEVTYFAKNLLAFEPSANGKPVRWDKASYSRYRLYTGGAKSVKLEYTYHADSLDNAMAWSRADFLLVNGTNIFFYPEDQSLSFPATVTFHTQPGWTIATPMRSSGTGTYSETNFHDLVDMPVFIGVMDYDSAQANGKWNRLASYPKGKLTPPNRAVLLDEIGKMLKPEADVFGEMPWQAYTTMIIWDSAYGGASALEHQRSHVGVYNTNLIGNPIISSITAHEIFHAWNVKRMRPSEMWPYKYGAEQPTPWLWVSEGITDYYADLAMSRAKVGPDDWFYQATGLKIATVRQTPPVALEDASLSTWIHPIDGTGYIYYQKGSLAGFMLDILIREASNNRRSLDTVMREVYTASYKNLRGFTEADWWGAVSRAAGGASFATFKQKYIDGREDYPWETMLPKIGLRMRSDTVYDPRLGINTNPKGDSILITSLVSGGEAEAAGVQAGDIMVMVGDVNLVAATGDPFQTFRDHYRSHAAGSDVPIVVVRNGKTMTLHAKLRLLPTVTEHLEPDPSASEKAVRLRNGILNGTTD